MMYVWSLIPWIWDSCGKKRKINTDQYFLQGTRLDRQHNVREWSFPREVDHKHGEGVGWPSHPYPFLFLYYHLYLTLSSKSFSEFVWRKQIIDHIKTKLIKMSSTQKGSEIWPKIYFFILLIHEWWVMSDEWWVMSDEDTTMRIQLRERMRIGSGDID